MRPAIWSGGRPVYCQTTPITGIRMSGKMSVGVRSAASGPMIRRSSASTTKVYGRLSAIRTSAIINQAFLGPRESAGIGTTTDQCIRIDLPEAGQKTNARMRSLPWHPAAAAPAVDESVSQDRPCQAALTELRNLPTSSLRRLVLAQTE